jgi:hypothetical protein
MLLQIASLGTLFLSAFDARLTAARIARYGKHVELNEWIQKMSTALGPYVASYLAILGPAIAVVAACLYFNQPLLLGVYLGMRLKQFHYQLLSLIFEKRLLAFKKALDERNGSRQSATLPDYDADASTSPRDPKSTDV